MTPKDPSCPYGANDCPKLEDVNELAKENQRQINNITKLLYTIIGMIVIEWGVSLWR